MGSVWTTADFADLGERTAIAKALSRHVKAGDIKRIGRGLYTYPQTHPVLGELTPSIETIVDALKGRDQVRLLPTGAYAANLLHLSEQVPARIVFLSDGPNRKVQVGKLEIELKHVAPKRVAAADRMSGLIVEALRYMGKDSVSERSVATIAKSIDERQAKQLISDLRLAPAWMRPHLRAIAQTKGTVE
ncbi:type IV toxin-antitoxin system AbiEi family antitoxin domain-containing protein [Pelagicoccus sp. NFK12]|uniref:Type IV toxin-antitoxin system AbiEi family antitoxin domain-containing protein n=2 Tax=Pelagicoccus enzymogenes TaxID=2773457 RepID=A0A927FCW1_9BACT|nr:type IV toxin-antitoxin system AbiEi family antitoxin domain-containing protein [Pelagicoccus enzymogenes]